MAVITFPSDTKSVIDDIRSTIGRNITIHIPVSGVACTEPSCTLDPITNLSTDQFCQVCGGNYWLETTSEYEVMAHVTHKSINEPVWVPGGIVMVGDATIQIEYTEDNLSAVESADYYTVDSKEYITKEFILRGVPTINRIIVALVERDG